MRRTTLAILLAAGCSASLLLAGCVPSSPRISASPQTSEPTGPASSTDGDYLRAAVATFERYVEISAGISHGGGHDVEQLESVSAGEALEDELELFASISKDGLRSTGSPTFDHVELVSHEIDESGTTEILVNLCIDVSSTRVLDNSGQDVTRADRRLRTPLEVLFTSRPDSSDDLIISRSRFRSEASC